MNVRLGEFDVIVFGLVREALVVVVHRDREHTLGMVLADHIIVEYRDKYRGGRAHRHEILPKWSYALHG